jgi:hypothetical protein
VITIGGIQQPKELLSVYVFDLLGQQVLSQTFPENSTLQVGHLPRGAYWVRVIEQGGGVWQEQFLIQ